MILANDPGEYGDSGGFCEPADTAKLVILVNLLTLMILVVLTILMNFIILVNLANLVNLVNMVNLVNLMDLVILLREAILQRIPEFYEIFLQTGGWGQPDFISLIQK